MKPTGAHLAAVHRRQLDELAQFLADARNVERLRVEGKTIAGLLDTYPPEVQTEARRVLNTMDYARTTQREMPFQERLTPEKVTDAFGFDHDTASRIYEAAAAEQVAVALQERMGTDADLPLPPVTRRDQVAAAVDLLEGSTPE